MRSVKRSIEEYRARYYGTREGSFYLSDARQILELAQDPNPVDTVFNAMDYAFQFAFMVGYRKAQSDAAKKESACR